VLLIRYYIKEIDAITKELTDKEIQYELYIDTSDKSNKVMYVYEFLLKNDTINYK